jgi:hypothetical protein
MSDTHEPPGPPAYGQVPGPPPGQSPYGVPPAGDLPYGQVPYGQTPYHHNPYGQPTIGMPGYGAPLRDPDARPGTVLAAAIITFISAGLVLLVLGGLTMVLVATREEFVDGFRDGAGVAVTGEPNGWYAGLFIAMALLLLWCAVAIVLAVFTLRRSNGARIALVVSASLTALLSLLAIASAVSVVTLAASIAVIVCLFTGGAGAWFRRDPAPPGLVRY